MNLINRVEKLYDEANNASENAKELIEKFEDKDFDNGSRILYEHYSSIIRNFNKSVSEIEKLYLATFIVEYKINNQHKKYIFELDSQITKNEVSYYFSKYLNLDVITVSKSEYNNYRLVGFPLTLSDNE